MRKPALEFENIKGADQHSLVSVFVAVSITKISLCS